MQDLFKRNINYLRISVTDRCNLRCVYCMPPDGVKHLPHEEILTIEEIATLIKAASGVGIRKIRFTGGEPLVRKDFLELVAATAATSGIDDIALTTNGILLGEMGRQLKEAGLKRVNISLDTLRPGRFKKITRLGRLEDVKSGLGVALRLGLHPVKINTVVLKGINDDEVVEMAKLTIDRPLHVRFIELMPVGHVGPWARGHFVSAEEVAARIEAALGKLQADNKTTGAGPARYYRLPGASGTVGFITAISDHFCATCNRLRLTSTGQLRPCLHSPLELDVRGPLRRGASSAQLGELFIQAARQKPHGHNLSTVQDNGHGTMSQIGG